MKIEGDNIVIRVGGGYLTIDEFVQIYCYGQEDLTKSKITTFMQENIDKKFKTFYVTTQPN
jgi:predicted Rossmann-fold nucleotide-binding protein